MKNKNIQDERMNEIKGLIFANGYSVREVMEKFGFKSYEGFKKAIKKNSKNRYEEVLLFLKS